MSLTYWNRRRREAALEGDLRDPEAVATAAEDTAGQGGIEGVDGHTGTTRVDPPLGAADSSGIDTDGASHEDAAREGEGQEQGPESPAADPASDEGQEPQEDTGDAERGGDTTEGENGAEDGGQGSEEPPADSPEEEGTPEESAPEGEAATPRPSNGASRDAWAAWATDPKGGNLPASDIEGLGRDAIRDLFA